MTTAEIVGALKQFTNPQRLEVIEAATQLVREDLLAQARREQDARLREAARRLQPLYEPGAALADWNELDGENVLDDSVKG